MSVEYEGVFEKLLWECKNKHTWMATPDSIQSNSWCPECERGIGERIARAFFEQLFKQPFPSFWPDWLKNDEGNGMELDGYCEELGLAFEHQGRHHYSLGSLFIQTQQELDKRIRNDEIKMEECKKRDIKLVQIEQIGLEVSIDDLKKYMENKFRTLEIEIPLSFHNFVPDYSHCYTDSSIKFLEELSTIAINKGGKLLSKVYLGSTSKHEFECKNGHPFEAMPLNVKRVNGTWCPYCSKNKKLDIEQMKMLAIKKRGKCLSEKYINNSTHLEWECHLEHKFPASPNNVKNGTWCPICADEKRAEKKRKHTIEDMQKCAEKYGEKCLSQKYKNETTELNWVCKNDHSFGLTPKRVFKGHWCDKCN